MDTINPKLSLVLISPFYQQRVNFDNMFVLCYVDEEMSALDCILTEVVIIKVMFNHRGHGNSLCLSDVIWRQGSGSTLAHFASWHQAISWINADWQSVRSNDTNLRVILQAIPFLSSMELAWKLSKFYSSFSRVMCKAQTVISLQQRDAKQLVVRCKNYKRKFNCTGIVYMTPF